MENLKPSQMLQNMYHSIVENYEDIDGTKLHDGNGMFALIVLGILKKNSGSTC